MDRHAPKPRPSIVFATAAALVVALVGLSESVGSASVEPGRLPRVGESVVYSADGSETTWQVARVGSYMDGISLVLRRGDDLIEATPADVRRPGPVFGF